MKNIIINKKTRCRDKDKALQRLYIIDSRLKKTLFKEHSKFKYNIDFDTKTVKIVSNNANIGISSNHKLFTGRGTVSFKEINEEIVKLRTEKTVSEYAAWCSEHVKKASPKLLMQGLGEVLNDTKSKTFVKNKLIEETSSALELFSAFPLIDRKSTRLNSSH